MVFGSLVELHIGLHSCLCFSLLEKTTFKSLLNTSSIPCCLWSFLSFFLLQSRQFLNSWWIDRENSCLLNNFLTAGGLIELLFLYLMVCSSTPPQYLHLSMAFSSTPTSIDVSTPLNTCICRDLVRAYIISSCDPQLISFNLSLDSSLFSLPNNLISL